MRNNGRFTAAEEMIAMGGGEIFELIDPNCLHRYRFPGHPHASLYNVGRHGTRVKTFLLFHELKFTSRRASTCGDEGREIRAVTGKGGGEKSALPGMPLSKQPPAGPPASVRSTATAAHVHPPLPYFRGGSASRRCGVTEMIEERGANRGHERLLQDLKDPFPEIVTTLNPRVAVIPSPATSKPK